MLKELVDSKKCWPTTLKRKDWDLIIELLAKFEIEKRYNQEIQRLCQTKCFEIADQETSGLNKSPVDNIVKTATKKAPLITSLIMRVGPGSSRYSPNTYIISMKLVVILVILCQSAYWNNSNYIPLFIALYFYSFGAKVDAIIFLNDFSLFVLYNMLQKKFYSITLSSQKWIKQ